MSEGEGEEEKSEIRCCISHSFFKQASQNPSKIAVVHASGGARIFREWREKIDCPDLDAEELLNLNRESSSPPLYSGDECFTYADILSAVEALSFRIGRILGGADDPDFITPEGYFQGRMLESNQNSESYIIVNETKEQLMDSQSRHPKLVADSVVSDVVTPHIIGIYIAPSVEYIVSVLSALRCGAAFLPLDSLWPKDRILSIISSSKVRLIIKCTSPFGDCRPGKDDWLANHGISSLVGVSMKGNLTECSSQLDIARPWPWPCEGRNLRMFCYLMYTSGSTGKPKAVYGTEKGLLNRLQWMQGLFPLHDSDVLLFKTSISFIDHLQEILGAILTSTPLVIPPYDQLKENPFYLLDFLKAYYVSRLTTVPSLMRTALPAMQSSHRRKIQESLQVLILSGEVLSISLWDVLHKLLPKTSILNLYGSTEVSGDCTYFDCKNLPRILEEEVLGSVPIGVPINNCDIALIGESGTPEEGELYVGGSCLSVGYLLEPTVMSSDYIMVSKDGEQAHNCVGKNGSQLYFRTGDFARQLRSGDFVFLGRKDRMIKVNGHRVALEEVENVLRDHPDVIDAVVTFHKGDGDYAHLVAHLVLRSKDEDHNNVKENHALKGLNSSMKSWLGAKLPPAMIPHHYFVMESLPLTSSGKLDYALLTRPKFSMKRVRDEIGNTQGSNDLLQVIKKAFSEALMTEEVTEHSDFFAMGGNSITAAQVAYKLHIDMRLIYICPTPSLLLKSLSDREGLHGNMSNIDHDLGIRSKAQRSMVCSFESMDNNLYSNKSLKSQIDASSAEDVYHFTKQLDEDQLKTHSKGNEHFPIGLNSLKADSTLCTTSNGAVWISSICLPVASSFSRCNKVVYELELEGTDEHIVNFQIEIPRNERGFMQELWKVPLNLCVDASPLVVMKDGNVSLFIGSHSCVFLCINAQSGLVRWEVKLEGRIECSAAITGDFSQVVVGCYKGNIYFLDFMTGDICWTFQTGGEVKSQPIVDKCRHVIWCGSHDQNLYALDYRNHCCVCKVWSGGSIYGSPSIDKVRNMLYVASTSGRVTAVSLEVLPFGVVWLNELGAPIFGSLTINYCNGNVICCLVDGHVIALNSSGSIIWKAITGGPIFAGACISSTLPSQVLVCSRNGRVYSFELEGGGLLWEYDIGDPITSSAYIDENSRLSSDTSHTSDRLACICSCSGSIYVLRINPNAVAERDQQGASTGLVVQKFAHVELPGEIFSSPVMIGSRIFVGCRDDHVYCIEVFSGSR